MSKPYVDQFTRRGRVKFSGKSWQELEDIWPRSVRLKQDEDGNINDAYKIMSVLMFAIRKAQQAAKAEGYTLRMEDIFLLFWCQRVEEAKENMGAGDYETMRPLYYTLSLNMIKRHRLFQAKMLEYYPGDIRVCRVTAKGKVFMSTIMENIEQAHRDIKMWTNTQPEELRTKIGRVLSRFTKAWEKMNL